MSTATTLLGYQVEEIDLIPLDVVSGVKRRWRLTDERTGHIDYVALLAASPGRWGKPERLDCTCHVAWIHERCGRQAAIRQHIGWPPEPEPDDRAAA